MVVELFLRVVLHCACAVALFSSIGGCRGDAPGERAGATSRAPGERPDLSPRARDAECAQLRAELGGNPGVLMAQRRVLRERVTARFGAPAFAALRATYGGLCEDDADLRCVLDEAGPFARVECVSPTRRMPEALYADGATLRRAEGVEAFQLALHRAEPAPTELEPVLAYFQRVTRAIVLRDRTQVRAIVPPADAEAMKPSSSALVPPSLVDGEARFLAYESTGYQAPRALLEVRVDLARRVAAIERVELARIPHPNVPDPPPVLATPGGARHDGAEGAVCAWGEYRRDRRGLPAPAACRDGLRCCSGGAAGSDGTCTRTGAADCPLRP